MADNIDELLQKYEDAQTSLNNALEALKKAYTSSDESGKTKILDGLATIVINSGQATEEDREVIVDSFKPMFEPASVGGRRKSRSKKRSTRLRKKTRSRSRR
jgi:hypothetical protein